MLRGMQRAAKIIVTCAAPGVELIAAEEKAVALLARIKPLDTEL